MVVKEDFYIGFKMVDKNFSLKSGEMLNFFVDMAGIHSKEVGDYFGAESRWILTAYDVKVFKKPSYQDKVSFYTWSRDYNPVLATREFEVRDESGELLVCATSNFVKYNIVSRKFDKLTDEVMDCYKTEREKTNFEFTKVKRFVEPDSFDGVVTETVDWKWLDLNHHMNNSHYVDLAERVINVEFGEDVSQMSFTVNYKKEIYENETVKVYYKKTETGFVVWIKNQENQINAGIEFYR